jgi:hypothetical protein
LRPSAYGNLGQLSRLGAAFLSTAVHYLLGEHELHLDAQLPVCAVVRVNVDGNFESVTNTKPRLLP